MECTVISGPDSGKPCIFPFEWNGETYDNCAHDPDDGYSWCATQSNMIGKHWGICNPCCFYVIGTADKYNLKVNGTKCDRIEEPYREFENPSLFDRPEHGKGEVRVKKEKYGQSPEDDYDVMMDG